MFLESLKNTQASQKKTPCCFASLQTIFDVQQTDPSASSTNVWRTITDKLTQAWQDRWLSIDWQTNTHTATDRRAMMLHGVFRLIIHVFTEFTQFCFLLLACSAVGHYLLNRPLIALVLAWNCKHKQTVSAAGKPAQFSTVRLNSQKQTLGARSRLL